jgi:hypothetical protein
MSQPGEPQDEEHKEYLDWYKKPTPYTTESTKPVEKGGVKAAAWCDYAYKEYEIWEKTQIPDWYWKFTPPTWSEEEQVMMERIMLKIQENIAKEKMTPLDRYWATAYGVERDRCPVVAGNYALATTSGRLLDSWGGVLKGVDSHRYPKLHVLGTTMAVAKFATDVIFTHKITYAEPEYGGHTFLKESSAPASRTGGAQETGFATSMLPFRTAPFLSHKRPSAYEGAYAMQIWEIKVIKEYLRRAGLWGIMPVMTNTCVGPFGTAGAALGPTLGIREKALMYKRNPEWYHAACREALRFCIEHHKAVRDAGTDIMFFCDGLNTMSPEMTADLAQYHVDLCKQVHWPPGGTCITGGDFSRHVDIILQAHGKYAYLVGSDHVWNINKALETALKYDKMWFDFPDWDVAKAGPKEKIAAYEKERFKIACSDPKSKYWNPGPADYWIPLENYEAWVNASKKYGSYPNGWEQP